jgi:hypothetical protein
MSVLYLKIKGVGNGRGHKIFLLSLPSLTQDRLYERGTPIPQERRGSEIDSDLRGNDGK